MSRKSSIHFKPVSNVRFAVSHSERTDLSEPGYLLPKEHHMPNVVVDGSISENELAALFIQQKEGMTRQAKTAGASPFWEGVVVLANTDSKEQSENLLAWKSAYEKATGHRVLHVSIHLDEGYVDATGHPQYNPHAHVIVSRMDSKNKVINLDRKQLATVQDLTAQTLKMERGSTLAERGGKRGRRHVGHREYRAQADEKRLDLSQEKGQSEFYGKLLDSQNAIAKEERKKLKDAKAEIAQLKAQYDQDRATLKVSGEATQKAYQALKISHEAAIAALKESTKKVEKMEKKITDQDAELVDVKAKFAAMATAYQAEKAKGTPAHLIEPGAPLPSSSKQPREAVPPRPQTLDSGPSLAERLKASLAGMVEWVKSIGAEQEPVGPSTRHDGPVKHLDDLHCVQKTGRLYAVHRLADLDNVPALDDPQMTIQYRDGKGTVKGKAGPGVHR